MQRIKTPVIFTLIVILAAGGSQYYANRAYRLQLEAGYRRAFRELAVHIDGMETELSKLLVANSPTQQFGGLANVLRLVYAAQANLGQLPIHGLNLARIENLLARVQAVAVDAAQGMHETKPLNAVRNELSQLYEQVRYVNNELQAQLALGEHKPSWTVRGGFMYASLLSPAETAFGEQQPLMQALLMIGTAWIGSMIRIFPARSSA